MRTLIPTNSTVLLIERDCRFPTERLGKAHFELQTKQIAPEAVNALTATRFRQIAEVFVVLGID